MELKCRGYETRVYADELITVNVEFILPISTHEVELVAESLKKLELFLAGSINLVMAVPDKQRCFYCATLNDPDENLCTQCGAPL